MKRFALALACAASLAACSTSQVTATCHEAQTLVSSAQPFLTIAPASVQAAVTAIGIGAVVCGSPQYAAMREQVIGFLHSRGAMP